jgi:hypothetical protein
MSGLENMIQSIRDCHRDEVIYTPQVRLNWNIPCLALLAALSLAGTGCSGINASQTVSPASFFLPGLMKNDAPTNAPILTPEISTEIAIAR